MCVNSKHIPRLFVSGSPISVCMSSASQRGIKVILLVSISSVLHRKWAGVIGNGLILSSVGRQISCCDVKGHLSGTSRRPMK